MNLFVRLLTLALLASCSQNDDTRKDLSDFEGQEFAGETYDEFDERRESYGGERGEFAGDGCTVDCSGHEAGYAWAEDRDITDPDDCGGKSWSFEEGCRAYAIEQSEY